MTYPLIHADEAVKLHGNGKANTLFLDATFHLSNTKRDAKAEFHEKRIKDAQFFDIDAIADPNNPLPHMMPDAKTFTEHMQRLGVNSDSHVIVYDQSPFYSSARAWFMLRLFGHAQVQVLNGGLKAWLEANGEVESSEPAPIKAGNFVASSPLANEGVIDLEAMLYITSADTPHQILDARSAGRFAGREEEPRPHLKKGHMPKAINIPIASLIDSQSGLFKSEKELTKIFSNIDLNQPIITTCGSGVTACGLALGLAAIGTEGVILYDGSWSEWGSREDCPIIT